MKRLVEAGEAHKMIHVADIYMDRLKKTYPRDDKNPVVTRVECAIRY
jgi:hypothetical protein